MISVCMATYNGEKYIKSQIESILSQIPENAELIISDDGSNDRTLEIISSINDDRISVYHSKLKNLIKNFENAISQASGNIIFLTDQDDIWKPNKVERMLEILHQGYDVVTCDCSIFNSKGEIVVPSYFEAISSGPGFMRNIIKRNSYMGCCMAFTAEVKKASLPFPKSIPMHDLWIGLISEVKFKPYFLRESLVLYRQHENNASSTASGVSGNSLLKKLHFRMITLYYLAGRVLKFT